MTLDEKLKEELAQEIREEINRVEVGKAVSEETDGESDGDFEEIESETKKNAVAKNKKKIIKMIYDILIVLGVAMLIFGVASLYTESRSREEAKSDYDELEDLVVVKPNIKNTQTDETGAEETGVDETSKWYESVYVDMEALKAINEDIIGWIFFENEKISYPILYSIDNDEYDRKMYNGVEATCGSITLEARNNPNFSDQRNIIYGHNMADMTMFGRLKWYKNEGYYEDNHQYFQIIYGDKTYRYQIFSYFDVQPTEVDTININFGERDTFESCIEMLKKRSRRDHGVEVTAEDQIITLVTCSYYGNQRFLVSAVLVDEHELVNPDESQDITKPGLDDSVVETTDSQETEDTESQTTESQTTESQTTGNQTQNNQQTESQTSETNKPENGDGTGGETETTGNVESGTEALPGGDTETGTDGNTEGESGTEGNTEGESGTEGNTEGESGTEGNTEGESGTEGNTEGESGTEGNTEGESGTEGNTEGESGTGEENGAGNGTGTGEETGDAEE